LPKLTRFPNQSVPVPIEFFPYFTIKLACVGESTDLRFAQFRVKCTEVAQFSRNRRWGSTKKPSQFLYFWIACFGFLKRDSAIEFEGENQLIS
jgi:hypothetical protein